MISSLYRMLNWRSLFIHLWVLADDYVRALSDVPKPPSFLGTSGRQTGCRSANICVSYGRTLTCSVAVPLAGAAPADSVSEAWCVLFSICALFQVIIFFKNMLWTKPFASAREPINLRFISPTKVVSLRGANEPVPMALLRLRMQPLLCSRYCIAVRPAPLSLLLACVLCFCLCMRRICDKNRS